MYDCLSIVECYVFAKCGLVSIVMNALHVEVMQDDRMACNPDKGVGAVHGQVRDLNEKVRWLFVSGLRILFGAPLEQMESCILRACYSSVGVDD